MAVSIMDTPRFTSKIAVDLYRRFISPRKGFRCACGAAGNHTCSTFASKYLLRRYPLRIAAPLMLKYFGLCKESVATLRALPWSRISPATGAAYLSRSAGITPHQAGVRLNMAMTQREKERRERREHRPGRECPAPGPCDPAAASCHGPAACEGAAACLSLG
jgi:hypothetical protein